MWPMPFLFFFNDTATTEIYTLSLHDALPISLIGVVGAFIVTETVQGCPFPIPGVEVERVHIQRLFVGVQGLRILLLDRKSTRLNSSHANISYAVFCLKKKIIQVTATTSYIMM